MIPTIESTPTRRITSQKALTLFQESQTFADLVQFIQELQDLVVGLQNDDAPPTPISTKLSSFLDKVNEVIDNNPVVQDTSSRFGKAEFRDFYEGVEKLCGTDLVYITTDSARGHLQELSTYFTESWGNKERIDYGSGHELNFICFLFCLKKLDVITSTDYSLVVLVNFNKYMAIMRRLQKTYWLEPAGSHGVWGLDDYHFLPFLFGSAQLATHEHFRPKLIHNEELVDMFYEKYMYFECIHFINSIKTVPGDKLSLRWHSPMLDDILAAKSWRKISDGMIKMYKVEVLSKLPIIQHFLFGELIKCPEGIMEEPLEDSCGHDHLSTWGDCCGIKVPSGIAASESLRRIPFD